MNDESHRLSPMESMKRFDERRPGFLGEHWVALGAAATLLAWGRTARSPVWRLAALVGGIALFYRAASGRDGLARLLQ